LNSAALASPLTCGVMITLCPNSMELAESSRPVTS